MTHVRPVRPAMKTSPQTLVRQVCRHHLGAGFTLVELLVALAVFGLVGGMAYAVLLDGFNQFIRNISLNKSENSLRYTLQRLKRDVSLAVQPPTLVSYDPTRANPLMAVPVSNVGLTSAAGIRLVVNSGPAYCLTPAGSAADAQAAGALGVTTPANTLSFRLWRHVPSAANGTDPAPVPFVDPGFTAANNFSRNDRLMFLNPAAASVPAAAPWPASTQQIISEGTAPAVVTTKPGRRLTSLTVGAANAAFLDVTVEDLRPTQGLPGVFAYNAAYIVHEVAYAVFTNRDAAGKALSRELRYFPSADDPANFEVVCLDLDPNPQEQARDDAGNLILAAGVPQPVLPFTVQGSNLDTLRVNMPIRARDYAQVVAERRLGAAGNPDVASEFNVSISAKPFMGYRNSVRN